MTRLTYNAEWCSDYSAGVRPGSEEITITFEYNQPLDAELVEYWRESIAEFYDGASVTLIKTENNR